MRSGSQAVRRGCVALVAGASAGGIAGLVRVSVGEARRLWGAREDPAFADLLVACALGVLVCAALRLLLAGALAAWAAAVGRADGAAARLARALAPAVCRALLGGACGAALLAGPPAAADHHSVPAPHPGVALPVPDRPLSSRASARQVRVRAGDSLWAIARRHLPATASDTDVAEAWPRWYRASRRRIGPDPHLIHPGTRLRVPPRLHR